MFTKPSPLDTTALLAFHKLTFGDAKMEDGVPPVVEPKVEEEKQLPQSQVNALVQKAKDDGKAKALKDLQAELGVDLETAKSVLKAAQEQQEAQKTEAQKATDAATKARETADRDVTSAKAEIHKARLTTAMVLEGQVDEAKIERYSKLVEVEVGASAEDVRKAVAALKVAEPLLFGGEVKEEPKSGFQRPPAPSSDPKSSAPKSKGSTEDAFQRGIERAAQYGTRFTAFVENGSK